MNTTMIKSLLSSVAISTLIFSIATAKTAEPLRASDFKELKPLDEYSKTNKKVLKLLQKDHYKNIIISNDFSEKLLDRYLEYLDPSKSYFTQSDIKKFKRYKYKLDDAISEGDLRPAYNIFNTFQERRIERTNYLLEQLEQEIDKIDFSQDDFLDINQIQTPWLANSKAANELWRKQFKNDVLNLKLSDKPNEEISTQLNKRYVNQLNRILQTNSEDVFQIYLDAFTQLYDPHTRYLPPRESENFDISMSLSLEGIGALLQKENDYTKVVRLIHAGPAEKSKLLKPADRIVGVAQGTDGDMIDVVGWRLDEVVELIRGPKGTIVRLNLIPADGNESKEIQITRETVKLEEQAAQKNVYEITQDGKPFKVGIITLPTFYIDFKAAQSGDPNYRSSSKDVAKLLLELADENIKALIIDLRNNGGGSLQEAKILTGLFIRSGPIVQIRENNNLVQTLRDHNPGIAYKGPLAVLVNRLSASASEIFAGAIQDSGRGIIVGGQTFGKGTVQTINPINPGQLKYTQAKFYRISGASTQHKGIIPDIQYPELYDKDEIGESTQDDALPWDQIPAQKFSYNPLIAPIIPQLNSLHKNRIKTNAEFNYLHKRIDLLSEARKNTKLTLNEKQRRQEKLDYEQKLLTIENEKRKVGGKPQLKTYKDLETVNLEEEDKNVVDALLKETGNILYDLQNLSQQRMANLPKESP